MSEEQAGVVGDYERGFRDALDAAVKALETEGRESEAQFPRGSRGWEFAAVFFAAARRVREDVTIPTVPPAANAQ